jgi:hypothetical protein
MPTFCDRLCDSDVEALEALRSACHRLLPSWQNPHTFFEQRSEITSGLTKLLRLLGSEPRQLNGRVPRPDVLPHQARAAAAIRLATLTLGVPPAAAQEAQDGGEPPAAPRLPALVIVPVRRRLSRRHRYPLPPRQLASQGTLL